MTNLSPEQRGTIKTGNHFSRFEYKYWITESQKRRLISYLKNFMESDGHNDGRNGYKIQSLYFDSNDLISYYEKYDGDCDRSKYRIRFYDDRFSRAFFEIKQKRNLYVRKIRKTVDMPSNDTPNNLAEIFQSPPPNVEDYIAILQQLAMKPMCWVAYRRYALFGKNNPKLRVTFDDGLSGGIPRGLSMTTPYLQKVNFSNWNKPVILEIKFDRYLPTWLKNAIEDLTLVNQPISKYGLVINRHRFFSIKERQWTH